MWISEATDTELTSTGFWQAVKDFEHDGKLGAAHHFIRSLRCTRGPTKTMLHQTLSPTCTHTHDGHDIIFVFDFEIAQSMGNRFFQTRSWATNSSSLETYSEDAISSECRPSTYIPSISVILLRSASTRHTSRSHAWRDPTLDSDDGTRTLTLTPKPEFTLSLREPGPTKRRIAKAFTKEVDLELLELKDVDQFVRCAGCQWKHCPGAFATSLEKRVSVRSAVSMRSAILLSAFAESLTLEDDNLYALKKGRWTVVSILEQIHRARAHVFTGSFVFGGMRCQNLQKIEGR